MGSANTWADIQTRTRKIRGCWVWTGAPNSEGYGTVRYEGRMWKAHRLFYTMLVGPIPEGLTLDHTCRRRLCVRPEHLEPVTQRVNVLRGQSTAAKRARQTHCKRNHPFNAVNTHVTKQGYRKCRVCDREKRRVVHR